MYKIILDGYENIRFVVDHLGLINIYLISFNYYCTNIDNIILLILLYE